MNEKIAGITPIHKILTYPLHCGKNDKTSAPLLRLLLISVFLQYADATIEDLAKQMGIGERTLYRGLATLRKMGLVHTTPTGRPYRYIVDAKVYS